ncbi:hypothetical protein [Streptomyces sp. NPDC087525]|uniref:hypothetical protein n=1 Tax=Streptomyces sp. NPDC087525 TaxID=3365793 RepID=UPI00381D2BBA
MAVYETDDRAEETVRARGGLWVPGLVNLALGVPAIVPIYLLWWLLTEYLPMDCRQVEDVVKPGVTNCNFTTLDHAGVVMFLLAVTGLFMLALVFLVDVVLPRRRGRRTGVWLMAALLVPVPFMVCLVLA